LIHGAWCVRKVLLPTAQGDVLIQREAVHDLEHDQTSFSGRQCSGPDNHAGTCHDTS
jgi:hypothetical protein